MHCPGPSGGLHQHIEGSDFNIQICGGHRYSVPITHQVLRHLKSILGMKWRKYKQEKYIGDMTIYDTVSSYKEIPNGVEDIF